MNTNDSDQNRNFFSELVSLLNDEEVIRVAYRARHTRLGEILARETINRDLAARIAAGLAVDGGAQ